MSQETMRCAECDGSWPPSSTFRSPPFLVLYAVVAVWIVLKCVAKEENWSSLDDFERSCPNSLPEFTRFAVRTSPSFGSSAFPTPK